MISYIKGKLTVKTPTSVVVETGGVGFHLIIPLSTHESLGEAGQDVRLLTYLHVREDVLQLFGFAHEDERKLFLLLLSITGIGPKVAQGILSGISVGDFESAVRHQNVQTLMKVPGVGKKTAERIVLELREKIGELKPGEAGLPGAGKLPLFDESVLALVSLGYKRPQAQEAVQAVMQIQPSLSIEEVLRQALQKISR